jgi:hypothetical protein
MWKKLPECKPRQGGVYLCVDDEDIQICGYWPGLGSYEWGSIETDRQFKPTHWMPLPSRPTAEQEEGANLQSASPTNSDYAKCSYDLLALNNEGSNWDFNGVMNILHKHFA